jgi:osmotically-inducible protein OsmY
MAILVLLLSALLNSLTSCSVMKSVDLQNTIKEELRQHRDIQADKLTIIVNKGVVTISGELYTQEEIDMVVEIVTGIEGVVEVKNQMNLPDPFGSTNPIMQDYGI